MTTITTLTEFLSHAGVQFQLFDMGRHVQPLDRDRFVAIEQQQEAYPWPLQRHAWLGVHFFQEEGGQHYLWFLKFPLDEEGKLLTGGPKAFMEQVVEVLGYQLTGQLDDEKAQQLANNPYIFSPAQTKLASVHAKLAYQLKQAPSAYYRELCHYLHAPSLGEWQTLGVQGFADLAEQLRDEATLELVCSSLPTLPTPVLYGLCQSLENTPLPRALDDALAARLVAEKASPIPCAQTLAYLCRAYASCAPYPERDKLILDLLVTQPSQDLLVAIAARLYFLLQDETMLSAYLAALAAQPPHFFAQIFTELVAIGALRQPLLGKLRDPARSEALSQAIGYLYRQIV